MDHSAEHFDYAVCRPATADPHCPHQGTCWLCETPVMWTDWLEGMIGDQVPRICVNCAVSLMRRRDRQN